MLADPTFRGPLVRVPLSPVCGVPRPGGGLALVGLHLTDDLPAKGKRVVRLRDVLDQVHDLRQRDDPLADCVAARVQQPLYNGDLGREVRLTHRSMKSMNHVV